MDLLDLADRPALNQLDGHAVLDRGMDLDAHLRDDLRLAGGGGHLPGLVDLVRQRLLAVDVLAAEDRRHGDGGVHVVGRGDVDGVDAAGQLVQQFRQSVYCLALGYFLAAAAGCLRPRRKWRPVDRPGGQRADTPRRPSRPRRWTPGSTFG